MLGSWLQCDYFPTSVVTGAHGQMHYVKDDDDRINSFTSCRKARYAKLLECWLLISRSGFDPHFQVNWWRAVRDISDLPAGSITVHAC